MKTKLLKITNKVLSVLISSIGIGTLFSANSCNTAVEYGVPSAKYKVNGKILSESGQPISNIQVTIDYDSANTNSEGYYEVSGTRMPLDTATFNLKFSDIDGEKNGLYKDKDTSVTFINPEFKGGDGDWYVGETTKELNINLDKHE